jgi:hypothetical protein
MSFAHARLFIELWPILLGGIAVGSLISWLELFWPQIIREQSDKVFCLNDRAQVRNLSVLRSKMISLLAREVTPARDTLSRV